MPRPANPHLRNEILRATMDLVESGGPEAVTMQAVASAVGYSPTTIYNHFEDKGDLLDQALTRGAEWLGDVVERAARGADSPAESLRRFVRAYIQWGLENPGVYRLVLEVPPSRIPSEETSRVRMRGFAAARDVIRAAMGDVDRQPDAEALTRLLWSGAHGLTSLLITRRLLGAATDPKDALPVALGLADAFIEQFSRSWLTPA